MKWSDPIETIYGRELSWHNQPWHVVRWRVSQHQGFVRILGWGVLWESDAIRSPSERVGHRWRVGPWRLQLLRPGR